MPSLRKAADTTALRPPLQFAALRPARLVLAAGVVVSLTVLGLAALTLWRLHDIELNVAQRTLGNLSQTLARHAARTFETVDLTLGAAINLLEETGADPRGTDLAERLLRSQAQGLPFVTTIVVYDARGERRTPVGRGPDGLPASIAHAPLLGEHRDRPQRTMRVALERFADPTRPPQLVLSRRVEGPAREFRGVIAASFDMRYLAGFYQSIELGPEAAIMVIAADGTMIVTHPWSEAAIGQPVRPGLPAGEPFADQRPGLARVPAGAGRPAAYAATAALDLYPLSVSVTETERAVLAGWRRQAATIGGSALLVAALCLALAVVLERFLRRRDEMLAQLRESESSLQEAHRIARLGTWTVDRACAVRCSLEAVRLVGAPPTSLTSLAAVIAQVYEEDRALAERALTPLTAGSGCDTELRFVTAAGEARWLRIRAVPAGDDGRTRCTVMDVTEHKRSDEARQHLAAIVESTDDAVMSIARDGRILSWNAGAARMFGFSPGETVGHPLDRILPRAEARETLRLIGLVADGASIEAYETVRTTKDGRSIAVAVTLSPISGHGGRVVAASAVARDVTTARQAQARTQLEHAVMRELAEREDPSRSLTRALRLVCERMGWQSGACFTGGRPEQLALTAGWQVDAPTASATPAATRVHAAAEPTWIPDVQTEPEASRAELAAPVGVRAIALVPLMAGTDALGVMELRSASPLPVEAAWLQTLRAVGNQIGLFLERRRAEEALRESEARFRSLADLSSDWYWEQDADLRFVAMSAGFARTGIDRAAFLDRQLWQIEAIEAGPGGWGAYRRAVDARANFHDLELALDAGDGETRFVSMSGQPVLDAAGELRGYRGIARDITPRKVAEARRAMEHAVSYLLAQSAPAAVTLPRILETICRAFGWERAVHWTYDSPGRHSRPLHAWPEGALAPVAAGEAGEALGTLTVGADPVWVPEVSAQSQYPRAAALAGEGLHSALLVPVAVGSKVMAVLELLSRHRQRPDAELLACARSIGNQIGQYLEQRRAEEALRAGKAYIDHVFASAPTLIATIAPDGTTRSVNPAVQDIADYAPHQIEGRNFWATLAAGEGPEHIRALLARAAHGRVADHGLSITTRAGERRELSVSIAARTGADGSVEELVLVGADITERQQEARRRATEHAVSRVLYEARSVEDGIIAALRTVCETFDWDCGALRVSAPGGGPVETRELWARAEPRLAPFVQALRVPIAPIPNGLYTATVAARAPLHLGRLRESHIALRDPALAAGLGAVLAVPVETGDRVIGVLQFFAAEIHRPTDALLASLHAVGRQVGQFIEQRRIEHARQQADERLRGIAANVPGVVFEYRLSPDETAAFSYVSERALDLLEEPAESLMADPQIMFGLVDRRYRPGLLRSMHTSRHTGSLWLYEMPIRTRSGRVRWVRGQSMPKYLDDGSVVWDGVIVDVTAQKQAEQAIQQMNEQLERRVTERTAQLSVANRELESFAYSVSHDLRAPLRSIDGFSRILLEEYGTRLDATAADYLGRVRAASQRMGNLIDDLLSLARVTRADLKRVRTDLTAMAVTIVAELRTADPHRVVDVSVHPGLTCMADPSLMRIALENLLGNAWKFTSRKPRASIELGALQQRGKTVYYVRDDGAGFDMAHAGKLFGAFQRLHSAREFDGTGIGLATVSRIVDRHGGRVWAEAAPGEGATFFFTLTRGRR